MCNAGDAKDAGLILGQKYPLEKEMVAHSLPGKSHEQRNLVGFSPWSHKESFKKLELVALIFFSDKNIDL